LQDSFGVAGHDFKGLVTFVGVHNLHHLDFVELMLADQAAGIAPGRTGLGPETRRVAGEFDG
jgi:hypothetical protein